MPAGAVLYQATDPAVVAAYTAYRRRRHDWELRVAGYCRTAGLDGPPVVDHTGRIIGFAYLPGSPIPPGWTIVHHDGAELLCPALYRTRADAEQVGRTRAPMPALPGMPAVLLRPPRRPLVADFTSTVRRVLAGWPMPIPDDTVGPQWAPVPRHPGRPPGRGQGRDAARPVSPSSAP